MKSEMNMMTSAKMMMTSMTTLLLKYPLRQEVVHLAWQAYGMMEGNLAVDPKIVISIQYKIQ